MAGVGSTFPAWFTARTEKVWKPSEVSGGLRRLEGPYGPESSLHSKLVRLGGERKGRRWVVVLIGPPVIVVFGSLPTRIILATDGTPFALISEEHVDAGWGDVGVRRGAVVTPRRAGGERERHVALLHVHRVGDRTQPDQRHLADGSRVRDGECIPAL